MPMEWIICHGPRQLVHTDSCMTCIGAVHSILVTFRICIMSTRSISTANVLRRVLEDMDNDSAKGSGNSISDQDHVSVAAERPSSNKS